MGKRFKAEEIVMKLREVEIHQGKGMDITAACRQVGITNATYYRWRKEYGGMKIDQAKKYKKLERENARLKELVDELLNLEIFDTLHEPKVLVERLRWEYNTIRPHSSLGYRPPTPEAIKPRWIEKPPSLSHNYWYN